MSETQEVERETLHLSKNGQTDVDDEIITARQGPRITPEVIEGAIVKEEFHIFAERHTVCCLTLRNGFTVVGQSACVSQQNFNRTIGEHLAREDAKRQIWQLEGYLLRDELSRE